MALQVYISQNENEKVGVVGNWYARVNNSKPIGIDELADLIKQHNIGQSKGTIVGILKDMVSIIRIQTLSGQPVKIDDLAIFKATVVNKGGWQSPKDVSLHIGGEHDNIQAIKMVAQATGDFTKSELSKDGRLELDRESARLVKKAGGTVDGDTTDDDPTIDPAPTTDPTTDPTNPDQQGGGSTDDGGSTDGDGD